MSNVIFKEDGSILVKNVRLVRPHLDKPWQTKEDAAAGKNPKFSGQFMMPKDRTEDIEALRNAIRRIGKENKTEKYGSDKQFFKDGDNGNKVEMEGHWIISATENHDHPPKCIGPRKNAAGRFDPFSPQEIATKFYGGCWVNVLVRPWHQNNTYGIRCNANLLAVQFVRDDEPLNLGGARAVNVDDEFDSVEGEYEADDAF